MWEKSDKLSSELLGALYDIGNGLGDGKFERVKYAFAFHDSRFDLLEWLAQSMPEIMSRRDEAAGPADFTKQFRLFLKGVFDGNYPVLSSVDELLNHIRVCADQSYQEMEVALAEE